MYGQLVLTPGISPIPSPLPNPLFTPLLCHLCSLLWNITNYHLPQPHINSCLLPINIGDQVFLSPPDHHSKHLPPKEQGSFSWFPQLLSLGTLLIIFNLSHLGSLPLFLKITLLTHQPQQDPTLLCFRKCRKHPPCPQFQKNKAPVWQLYLTLLDWTWDSHPPHHVHFYPE